MCHLSSSRVIHCSSLYKLQTGDWGQPYCGLSPAVAGVNDLQTRCPFLSSFTICRAWQGERKLLGSTRMLRRWQVKLSCADYILNSAQLWHCCRCLAALPTTPDSPEVQDAEPQQRPAITLPRFPGPGGHHRAPAEYVEHILVDKECQQVSNRCIKAHDMLISAPPK